MRPFINGTQCTAILPNKMQCVNVAVTEKVNDPDHRTSLCPVHVGTVRLAKDYHPDEWIGLPRPVDIDPSKVVETNAQTAANTLGTEEIHNEKI